MHTHCQQGDKQSTPLLRDLNLRLYARVRQWACRKLRPARYPIDQAPNPWMVSGGQQDKTKTDQAR
jgi:hypothetical protein